MGGGGGGGGAQSETMRSVQTFYATYRSGCSGSILLALLLLLLPTLPMLQILQNPAHSEVVSHIHSTRALHPSSLTAAANAEAIWPYLQLIPSKKPGKEASLRRGRGRGGGGGGIVPICHLLYCIYWNVSITILSRYFISPCLSAPIFTTIRIDNKWFVCCSLSTLEQ